MIQSCLDICSTGIVAVLDVFTHILNRLNATGIFLSFVIIYMIYKFFLYPVFGRQVGSDLSGSKKASKGKDERG